jgi:WD40 repeat protein
MHKACSVNAVELKTFAFSPNDRFLATGGKYALIWNSFDGRLIRKLPNPGVLSHAVNQISFSPDSRYVALGGRCGLRE